MDPSTYLEHIRTESAGLVAAARSAGLDRPVPSCPDWTVADLLVHVGRVQRWQREIVADRVQEPAFSFPDAPDDPAALPDWVRDGAEQLLTTFRATPPDVALWTLCGPGTAAFWFRRQAHETAMHRVDAQLAGGGADPIDAELARDGIDELLEVFVCGRLRDRIRGTGESLHFHRTDGAGEWLVRLTPDGPEVEHAHAKGDVAVRAGASDLLLTLRERTGPDAVEILGDPAVFERFRALTRI